METYPADCYQINENIELKNKKSRRKIHIPNKPSILININQFVTPACIITREKFAGIRGKWSPSNSREARAVLQFPRDIFKSLAH